MESEGVVREGIHEEWSVTEHLPVPEEPFGQVETSHLSAFYLLCCGSLRHQNSKQFRLESSLDFQPRPYNSGLPELHEVKPSSSVAWKVGD